MKTFYPIKLLFLAFSLFSFSTTLLAYDPVVASLEGKPLPEFSMPPIQIKNIKEGVKLYYVQDSALPVVEMRFIFQMAPIFEPADKVGITSFTWGTWRAGGSGKFSSQEMDRQLEEASIEIGTSVKDEYSIVSLRCLSRDLPKALELFFDLLMHPAFEEGPFEIVRQGSIAGLKRQNEDPMDVAYREFQKVLYGSENVWARTPKIKTVQAFSREEIQAFYKKYIYPANLSILVSSQISQREIEKRLQPYFENWTPSQLDLPTLALLKKEWTPGVYLVNKPLNQSSIVVGHFGDKRSNPDKFPIILANQILGGSTFGSRLGNSIRTTLGLAYSVNSYFGLDTDLGAFLVFVGTKSESTVRVVEEIKKQITALSTDQPMTNEELSYVKDSILNGLVFQVESLFQAAMLRFQYDFYGYPADYLTVYQRELKKVSLADIQRVLHQYFFPDRLITFIVGNQSHIVGLSQLGIVQMVNVTIE